MLRIATRRDGSIATLPQFVPPALPGYIRVPRTLGGVKMPSLRSAAIFSRHFPRSQGVSPHASSGRSCCGTSAAGFVGNGWVGEVCSPGTSVCGTGALLDGKHRLAAVAVEHEDEADLGGLHHDVALATLVQRCVVSTGCAGTS